MRIEAIKLLSPQKGAVEETYMPDYMVGLYNNKVKDCLKPSGEIAGFPMLNCERGSYSFYFLMANDAPIACFLLKPMRTASAEVGTRS
jgi:hypothetical protein